MHLGEVFKFETDQAIGHNVRTKIHIYVTKTDHFRAPEENVFLFISSGNYGGCFPIKQANYRTFLERDSYISCSNLVFYSDKYLADKKPASAGQISRADMSGLHGHLIGSEQMPQWQITLVCTALAAIL